MEDEKNIQDPAEVVDERERPIDDLNDGDRDSAANAADEGGGDVIIIK